MDGVGLIRVTWRLPGASESSKFQCSYEPLPRKEETTMQKLMTPDEIAEMLSVKKSTIYNWTHIGFIPHVKIGRHVRFREADILKWLKKKSVKGRNQRVPNLDI